LRPFVLAVKGEDGEWTTIKAVELLIPQPIKVNDSVPGMALITAEESDAKKLEA
jgi:hypothetical protein